MKRIFVTKHHPLPKRLPILILLLTLLLTSCTPSHDYDEEWIIGKDAKQIVERYGSFDLMFAESIEEISNGSAGYTIKEREPGFLQSKEEVLFMIEFKDGIASGTYIQEGRPGG